MQADENVKYKHAVMKGIGIANLELQTRTEIAFRSN